MAKYRVHEIVRVRVSSEPIEAEHPMLAYAIYRQHVNLDEVLRNTTGTKEIAEVEFAEVREKAIIDKLDSDDQFSEVALEIGIDDLGNPSNLVD